MIQQSRCWAHFRSRCKVDSQHAAEQSLKFPIRSVICDGPVGSHQIRQRSNERHGRGRLLRPSLSRQEHPAHRRRQNSPDAGAVKAQTAARVHHERPRRRDKLSGPLLTFSTSTPFSHSSPVCRLPSELSPGTLRRALGVRLSRTVSFLIETKPVRGRSSIRDTGRKDPTLERLFQGQQCAFASRSESAGSFNGILSLCT